MSVIGRKLILAMVYRVFHPGCQYDQVVIFQGGQGVGKSSAMRTRGEWFTDNLGAIGDKDALLIIHRHWLIEAAELDSMTKADADHFKQFVSSRVDEFRKPYGRVSEAYPRQCVLVGTTNREEFLKTIRVTVGFGRSKWARLMSRVYRGSRPIICGSNGAYKGGNCFGRASMRRLKQPKNHARAVWSDGRQRGNSA